MRSSPDQRRPEFRQLRIYAIDPMVSRAGEHQATVQIRYEPLELKGGDEEAERDHLKFAGRRVEIIDVDAAGPKPVWLKPVNLDDANIAMQHGLDPSESDPQFHQQMVYAVTMRTLEQFDRALGRVMYFKARRRLRLVPHAFRGGNASITPICERCCSAISAPARTRRETTFRDRSSSRAFRTTSSRTKSRTRSLTV